MASHERSLDPGQWHTRLEHYPAAKAAYLERTPERCCAMAAKVGAATSQLVETLLAERPLDRLRAVQAILRLQDTVGPSRLEAACARALYFGDVRYRRIKQILNAALDQEPLPEALVSYPPRTFTFARSGADFFAPVEGSRR